MDHGDPRSPLVDGDSWRSRLFERGGQITAALTTRLRRSRPRPWRVVIGSLLLGIYVYSIVASPSVAGFFVLLCLAVTGTYFAYAVRLLLPVYILALPALTEAFQRWIGRFVGRRLATGVLATSLVAIIVSDFAPRRLWPSVEARHHHLVRVSEALERELPDDARLVTGRGFRLSVALDRPVYSLRWSARLGAGIVGMDGVIDRHGVNTVVLDPDDPFDRAFEDLAVEHYGEGEWIGGVRVIRVRDE